MILLNPGPVNVSPRVTQALLRGDLCHREPEFSHLLESVRGKLVEAFAASGDYAAVPLTGSGTLALEAAVSSAVSAGRKLLAIVNGTYGERIVEMARAHGIEVVVQEGAWTELPDLDAVRAKLARDQTIEVVTLVHHETTTGLLNCVRAVGEIVHRAGRVFLVDAISGLAGDEIRLDEWGVDICVGVANKCIQGLPGVGFVLARRSELARMAAIPRRSVYLHLPGHYAAHERRSVPFTAAVQVLYALDEALSELLEETVAGRIARYGRAAAMLRSGFIRLGLTLLLPPEHRSSSITALRLPRGLDYATLHDRLKARGFVIYEGQGKLSREVFRVANMGALTDGNFTEFLGALAAALECG
jgi:2-aminoethylphosphonate-pyruvate transaminase